MRIVLNGWFLAHTAHTGTGQYTRALLECLPQIAPQHQYVAVAPGEAPLSEAAPAGVEIVRVRCGAGHLDKVRFEQQLFPAAARAQHADLIHVPYWAPPLSASAPVVVTIHDVIPLVLPEYRGDWRVRAYTALVSGAAAGAALILADSDTSRADIGRLLKLPAEKVRTVYLAAGDRYTARAAAEDEAARARYGLPESYVLYLGGFDARKNVDALLSAWTWAADSIGEYYPLVIGGALPEPDGRLFADHRALAQTLALTDSVRFIGPVAEADKPAVYRGAALFVYPSRYEGFGLPPLEAMACGVPVVTTNAGAIAEVVGDAAFLIDPRDARRFGASLITGVVEPGVTEALKARGLARAREFSWARTARETVAAYESVQTRRP